MKTYYESACDLEGGIYSQWACVNVTDDEQFDFLDSIVSDNEYFVVPEEDFMFLLFMSLYFDEKAF